MASRVNADKERQYKGYLVSLMKFLDDNDSYDRNSTFTRERLLQITPEDIMRKFNNDVWGDPNPPADHDITPKIRCHTIKAAKRAISYYMPNNMMVWNVATASGNPTRSRPINDLIGMLTRLETRRLGAPSKVRRAFNDGDFRLLRRLLKEEENLGKQYGIPAFTNTQFHMIARIDDTAQIKMSNLKSHPNFDFALRIKLNWAKNVREERDAPWQTVLSLQDHTYCTLLGLAVWLELFLGVSPNANNTPYLFSFSNDVRLGHCSKKTKAFVSKTLREKFRTEEFRSVNIQGDDDCVGSHSTRKFSYSEARNSGGSKDEADLRGRWKCRRVTDTYANVELPYPDAKIASYLCRGGPIRYHVINQNVTDVWILEHVATNIKKRFNNRVSVCLGRALLWAAFAQPEELPVEIRQRIMNAYAHLPRFDGNPVKKIPIIVTGDQGQVHMDDVPDDLQENRGGVAAGTNFIDRPVREQLLAMHSAISTLRRGQSSIVDKIEQARAESKRNFTTVKTTVQRMANTPARLIGPTRTTNQQNRPMTMAPATNQVGRPAVLAMPRDLYQLWNEYTQGLNGNKPASQFTAAERGRFKHKYTRRKVFWDHIGRLINSGTTVNVSIDRIYQVYGRNKSVTSILNALRRDRNANNLHVAIRV